MLGRGSSVRGNFSLQRWWCIKSCLRKYRRHWECGILFFNSFSLIWWGCFFTHTHTAPLGKAQAASCWYTKRANSKQCVQHMLQRLYSLLTGGVLMLLLEIRTLKFPAPTRALEMVVLQALCSVSALHKTGAKELPCPALLS